MGFVSVACCSGNTVLWEYGGITAAGWISHPTDYQGKPMGQSIDAGRLHDTVTPAV